MHISEREEEEEKTREYIDLFVIRLLRLEITTDNHPVMCSNIWIYSLNSTFEKISPSLVIQFQDFYMDQQSLYMIKAN